MIKQIIYTLFIVGLLTSCASAQYTEVGAFGSGSSSGAGGGVPTSRTVTVAGTASEISSSAGAQDLSVNRTWTLSLPSSMDLSSKSLKIPSSTTLPATCSVGQLYMDTDATSGQRFYLCEATNTWAKQGDGSGTGADNLGNHTATATLDMASHAISNVLGVTSIAPINAQISSAGIASILFVDYSGDKLKLGGGTDYAQWDSTGYISLHGLAANIGNTEDDEFILLSGGSTLSDADNHGANIKLTGVDYNADSPGRMSFGILIGELSDGSESENSQFVVSSYNGSGGYTPRMRMFGSDGALEVHAGGISPAYFPNGIEIEPSKHYYTGIGYVGYSLTAYAAGTVYTMTATPALLDFGTTDPSITLDKPGTYLIYGRALYKYNAATFNSNQTVTTKLRRTNNTAADLTSATTTDNLRITSVVTDSGGELTIPPVIYTTANTTDIIQLFGSVSAIPSSGSFQAIEASIVAVRLY